MPTLLSLPKEVLENIARYVRKSKDRQSLFLTCRELYDAVMPDLYRSVHFREADGLDALAKVLTPNNQALQHVRHLELEPTRNSVKERLNTMVKLIATSVPKGKLLSFTADYAPGIEWDATRMLHKTQRNLSTGTHTLPWPARGAFITTLQLPFREKGSYELDFSLPDLPVLNTLELVFARTAQSKDDDDDSSEDDSSDEEDADAKSRRAHAAAVANRRLNRLFADFVNRKNAPLRLRALVCYSMNLKFAGPVLRQVVQLNQLESLTLQSCNHPIAFISHFTSDAGDECENLRHLIITADADAKPGAKHPKTINRFLTKAKKLETLIMHVPDAPEFEVETDTLVVHANTLRRLYLNRAPDFGLDLKERRFGGKESFFELDVKLEQLAISLWWCIPPSTTDPFDEWSFHDFMNDIGYARSLRAVHLLVPPIEPDLSFFTRLWARRFADKVFSMVPSVKVVCVGDSTHAWGAPFKRFYAKGKVLLSCSEETTEAQEVGEELARAIEPQSELLNIDPLGQRILRFGFTRRG